MINTPLPRRKTRWRMMLLCVALLIGGGLIGASAATLYLLHRVTEAFDHPEQIPARMAARLHRRLDLSPDQTSATETILRNRQANLDAIRRSVQPQIDQQLTGLHDDIARLLSPGQSAKWDSLYDHIARILHEPTTMPSDAHR